MIKIGIIYPLLNGKQKKFHNIFDKLLKKNRRSTIKDIHSSLILILRIYDFLHYFRFHFRYDFSEFPELMPKMIIWLWTLPTWSSNISWRYLMSQTYFIWHLDIYRFCQGPRRSRSRIGYIEKKINHFGSNEKSIIDILLPI